MSDIRTTISFVFDDGGRKAAGYRGSTRDCGVRALAIAGRLSYQEAYDVANSFASGERLTKRKKTRSSARTGIRAATFAKHLQGLGWTWTPTMGIGTGCTVHVSAAELPAGRLILRLSGHYAAFVDGVLRDTYDSSRSGTRCVYGYWMAPA